MLSVEQWVIKYHFLSLWYDSTWDWTPVSLTIGKHPVTYSYADACRNIFNTIKTSGHSSLENYTSHFIWKGSKGLRKVLSVRGQLETEQNCNILTPTQLFWLQQHFPPSSWAAQPGACGPRVCWDMVFIASIFSPTNLNFLSPESYNNLTSTYFLQASQFALSSTLRQSRLSPDIFDRVYLLFTQVQFFFWRLDRVGGQYVTTLTIMPSLKITILDIFTIRKKILRNEIITGWRSFPSNV